MSPCLQRLALAGAFLTLAASAASAQTRYHVDDLGGTPSFGPRMTLNASGVGVGTLGVATLYDHGSVTQVRTAIGSSGSDGAGINDAGTVVGTSWDFGHNGTAWLYANGQYKRIGTAARFPGSHAIAAGINNLGQVAGTLVFPGNVAHPFLWRNGKVIDLGMPEGSTGAWTQAINDHHVVVGSFNLPDFFGHAFAWENGVMHDLGLPGQATQGTSVASGLNNAGTIVGSWFPDWGAPTHAVRWIKGSGVDLGVLPGSDGISVAFAVNDAGTIVGQASMHLADPVALAMVYDASGMHDLNTLVDDTGAGWQLQIAYSINASGQILGVGRFGNESHAFLATPLP